MYQHKVFVRYLGLQKYQSVLHSMHQFTDARDKHTPDEIWLVEHYPVFTQGQAGKMEHVLTLGGTSLIKSDRGGQITYHGPGQQVMYVLLDLKRRKMNVRTLVILLEQTVIKTLARYDIDAHTLDNAPGVYVRKKKICFIGLRIRRGCSFHGLALNVNMDLSPFLNINPCGYVQMEITHMHQWIKEVSPTIVAPVLVNIFLEQLKTYPVNQSFNQSKVCK